MKRFTVVILAVFILAGFSGCGNPANSLSDREKADLAVYAEEIGDFIGGSKGDKFMDLYDELLESGDKEIEKEMRELLKNYMVAWAGAMSTSKRKAESNALFFEEQVEDLDFFSLSDMKDFGSVVDF